MSDMKAILVQLRRPFPPQYIEWLPQRFNSDRTKAAAAALWLAYYHGRHAARPTGAKE